MGDNEESVFVKWDSHNNDLLKRLNSQRKSKQFTDVTLAVGDANIGGHRVVLSACSSYFSNILARLSDCPHPVIVINDTSAYLIEALLDYMYTGEMSIKQQDMPAIIRAAKSLGIPLMLSNLSPLATSELVKSGLDVANSTTSIMNRPRSQNGRKGYRPKRLCTSSDSGNMSASNSEGNNASPNSLLDRSYQSCPSRGSSGSPVHHHAVHEEPEHKEGGDAEVQKSSTLESNPIDYSRNDEQSPGRGFVTTEGTAHPAEQKDKKAAMSILDSYLRNDNQNGSHTSLPPIVPAPGHLAAAQNLAWLSQQGFRGLHQPNKIEAKPAGDCDSDKENLQATQAVTAGLPTMSMDIAGRLQKAFWAANFNRDNPYWMNPTVNPGFAAVAAAAAAAASTTAASQTVLPTMSVTGSMDDRPSLLNSNILSGETNSNLGSNDSSFMMTSPTGSTSRGRKSFRGRPRSTMPSLDVNGKPSVSCETCGKILADPSSLYRHRKIHTGEKAHTCPYCGRKFIQRYNMTQHIKTHFKERGINSLAAKGFGNLAQLALSASQDQDCSDSGFDMKTHENGDHDGQPEAEDGMEDEEEEIEPC